MFQRAQLYLLRHRLLAIGAVLILALLIVGVGVAFAFAGRTPAQGQNCSEVHTLNAHFIESEASVRQAENCFWQAFQQCSAASLTFQQSGIDAGVIHTFTTVNNNGKCSISDVTQHYIAPNPTQAGQTYTCTGLARQADGLHFLKCGAEGNIVVPLPLAQQCGTVQARANGPVNPAAARQAEDCFWRVSHACRPATLVFSKMGVDTVLTRTFMSTEDNGKCAITDTVQNGGPDSIPTPPRTYTCASLTQQADGLHFTSCGADGDILVPAA
jgi:hypothetical protein